MLSSGLVQGFTVGVLDQLLACSNSKDRHSRGGMGSGLLQNSEGREIADVRLAVNRSHGKSYYIPCIVWGRNAKLDARLEAGGKVRASLQGKFRAGSILKCFQKQNLRSEWHMKEVSVEQFLA